MHERLARETQQMTGLMVGYEVMKVSRLLSGRGQGGDFKIYLFMDWELVERS